MRLLRYIFVLLVFNVAQGARYAAVVMDMRTGAVLESEEPDSMRYPASLTKKMSLYLLFEALQYGKLDLKSPITISHEAASQLPSKLGLKTGERVSLEVLMKGLITRSANDAAVAVAEAVGGSTTGFVRMMNRKARELGMIHTTFRNPSGLPDPQQVTTARDMAILARALYRDFPTQYRLFKMRSFSYKGQLVRSHNHLLGRVRGLDGIKTGYTNASGFNLTACAQRDDRRLIVVVMGGPNRHWRDERVSELFEKHFNQPIQENLRPYEVPFPMEKDNANLDSLINEVSDRQEMAQEVEEKGGLHESVESMPLKNSVWVKAVPSHVKKKKPQTSAGIQVGGVFTNKLSALLTAQRVARFSGGKIAVKTSKKGSKTFYRARVTGLSLSHAKAVCGDLSSTYKECTPFTSKG